MALKDYPDFQREVEEIVVNAVPSSVRDYPDFQREVEVVAGAEGMTWEGVWDREAAYKIGALVRDKGKTYVCIEGINAVPSTLLGPGPPPGVPGTKSFSFLEGKTVAPAGLIVSGEEWGGTLKAASPTFREENFGPFQTWHAQVWQLNMKEAEANAEVTFDKTLGTGLPETFGQTQAYWGNDAGEQTDFQNLVIAGSKFHSLLAVLPKATKVAGTFRFYLIVFGGLWQHVVEGKIVVTPVLPLPFVRTFTSGAIAETPANKPPAEDIEHWALLAGA